MSTRLIMAFTAAIVTALLALLAAVLVVEHVTALEKQIDKAKADVRHYKGLVYRLEEAYGEQIETLHAEYSMELWRRDTCK